MHLSSQWQILLLNLLWGFSSFFTLPIAAQEQPATIESCVLSERENGEAAIEFQPPPPPSGTTRRPPKRRDAGTSATCTREIQKRINFSQP